MTTTQENAVEELNLNRPFTLVTSPYESKNHLISCFWFMANSTLCGKLTRSGHLCYSPVVMLHSALHNGQGLTVLESNLTQAFERALPFCCNVAVLLPEEIWTHSRLEEEVEESDTLEGCDMIAYTLADIALSTEYLTAFEKE